MKQKQLRCRIIRHKLSCILLLSVLILGFSHVKAQDIKHTVTGVVSTTDGESAIGVQILEKGTINGTTTSIDGDYSLTLMDKNATLVFSYVGMITEEVKVAGQTTINVVLQEKTIEMDEIIVIGYGTTKKSDLTGSVASIKSDLLENKPVASFDNALRGQIAGVSVRQNDGQPGGGSSIRIRGTSSINGTNEPLYVIDGVLSLSEKVADDQGLVINPLSSLNPNDIESIEVLKDASATAIYGARGANGVIIVTTKKGKAGRGEIKVNATTTIQKFQEAFSLLNGAQLAQLGKEAYENANMPVPQYFQDPSSVVTQTNWLDEIFRTAITQNYQISYNGGAQNIKYNLSAGYFNQEGVIIDTNFDRYTFRGQISADVNNYISVGSSLGYSQVETTGYGNAASSLSLVSMAMDMNPALPVYDQNGNYIYRNNLSSSNGVYGGNPVATAKKADMKNRQNRLTGNIFMDVKLLKNSLVFKTQLGVDDIYSLDRMYLPNDIAVSADGPGKGNVANYSTKSWTWDNTLTYNNKWNKHSLTAMIGQTAQKMTQDVTRLGTKNFEDNRLGYYDLSLGKEVWLTQTPSTEWAMLSYLGRIHYSFDSRYLATFTGRIDGSSKFGVNNKYGFFPSIAGAWRASEENFLKNIKDLSNLKLRLSYGVVGNAGISPYQSQGTLVSVNVPFGSGVNGGGLAPMTLPNADLSWETTSQYNIGLDLGLFNNRLSFVTDFYRKNTTDLLYMVEMPMYSGYLYSMRNLGDLSNQGFELSITGIPLRTKDIEWVSTFNFDTNVTRIEKLNVEKGVAVGTGVTRMRVGDKYGNIWGYKTNGIAQIGEDLTQVAQLTNRPMVAGEQKYADLNNDGIININDETVLGNIFPEFTFGFNNSLIYKDFSVNLFIEGSYGNDIINYTRKSLEGMDGSKNNMTTVLDRWTPSNPNASLPRADHISNSGAFSDRWVEDGSYLRIRDLTIGYNIPKKVLNGIASVKIFTSFENLYTWTKYSGYDPAIGGGIDNNLYPTSRKYSFGLSLAF